MKKALFIISFLFTCSFIFAENNVQGTWKSTGKAPVTLILQTNGDNVSGTIEDNHGKQNIPASKINNNVFSFNRQVPQFDAVIKYSCTIKEDGTLLVTVSEPSGEKTVILQKAK